MKTRLEFGAFVSAAVFGISLPVAAQTTLAAGLAMPGEQQEADYRVIAARCGTPAFEKAFFKDSKAAVAAGLISKGRDPAEVEKRITSLRRNPFVLVAASADCPAQLVQLKELQKSRSGSIRKTHGRSSPAK
jgi:hypothetical protein